MKKPRMNPVAAYALRATASVREAARRIGSNGAWLLELPPVPVRRGLRPANVWTGPGLNPDCCSGLEPCPHQKLSPKTVCDICAEAADLRRRADAAAREAVVSQEVKYNEASNLLFSILETGVCYDPDNARAALEIVIARAEKMDDPPRPEKLTLGTAPVGTYAPAIGGGHWYRTEFGWKWNGPGGSGGVFPTVGGDWNGALYPPGTPRPKEFDL